MAATWTAREGRVIAIGECMVELSRTATGQFQLAYGGDTFNTAVYMARAGVPVAYATLLGDDPYSAGILALAKAEKVATDLMSVMPSRNAGLYLIETTATGERAFHYWRERSPARELFDAGNAAAVASAMNDARLIYLSGITLSLYSAHGLDALEASLIAARSWGAIIAMDGNYRPRGWGADAAGQARARATFERFFRLAHVALPTFDDEQALWGDTATSETLARLASWGVGESVLKQGADGAIVQAADVTVAVPCPTKIAPVDTTAAGDSFNAAYLAARLKGSEPPQAALAGHALAGQVIQHRGAIMPLTRSSTCC